MAEEKVRAWFTAESPPGNAPPGAQYFYPYQPLEGHGLSPAQLEEAESETCSGLHRIIVHLGFVTAHGELDDKTSIAALGGLMRHELEHARQLDALGTDFLDMDGVRVDHVLSLKAGGLEGSTVLHTLKPAEQDANAAAAVYIKQHHPGAVEAILEHPALGQLARSNVGPEGLDTLVKRTVCFLYLYRDLCLRSVSETRIPFDQWLDVYFKSAGATWRALEAGRNEASASG